MILTRSERNIVAHIFAGFLFNPYLEFYPLGVEKVLRKVGSIAKEAPPLTPSDVSVAYEAQMIDLLYLPGTQDVGQQPSKSSVTRTAYDIVVQHHDRLTCFEVKFLSGWKPDQLQVELDDCEAIRNQRGYSKCDLILLYPSWRKPSARLREERFHSVRTMNWEDIRDACTPLPGGLDISTWMEAVSVPEKISINGVVSTNHKRLFS